MPVKLDAGSVMRAKFPRPSIALLDSMAVDGMNAACAFIIEWAGREGEIEQDHDEGTATFSVNGPKNDDPASQPMPDNAARMMWAQVARAMYARMAIHAGARPEGLKEPE